MQTIQRSRSFLTVQQMTFVGLLSGISILLSVTPLGFMPIPFLPFNPTIMHIPVVIGAILGGPLVGGVIGGIFGLTSLIRAFTAPTILSFIFWNPIVSIGVRILIGVVTGYLYRALRGGTMSIAIAALVGSMTNTVGVLGLAYLFYIQRWATAFGISVQAARSGLLATIVTNGIPEAILCAVLTVAVVKAARKGMKA